MNYNKNLDSLQDKEERYVSFWSSGFRRHYMDKTGAIVELIAFGFIFLVAAIALVTLFFAYPISFEDPIATIKNDFMAFQLIMIVFSGISVFLIMIFSKKNNKLVQHLIFFATIILLMIVIQLVIKINIDNKYNEDKFGEIFEQIKTDDDENKKYSIGTTGIYINNDKDSYIEQSMEAFNNFKMKTTLYIMLHIIVEIVVIFLIYKLKMKQIKTEKVDKDFRILDDEEKNIRY